MENEAAVFDVLVVWSSAGDALAEPVAPNMHPDYGSVTSQTFVRFAVPFGPVTVRVTMKSPAF